MGGAIVWGQSDDHKEDWIGYQIQKRKELIQDLPNEFFKKSIFREIYLKGFIQPIDIGYLLNINFNLHGFDCGAPDCFSTNLGFVFNEILSHRETIKYSEYEYGWGITNTDTIYGEFEIIHHTEDLLFLHDPGELKTFIIRNEADHKLNCYYFNNVNIKSLTPNTLSTFLDSSIDESIHPMMNTWIRSYDFYINDRINININSHALRN